jgi:hypothetical protein
VAIPAELMRLLEMWLQTQGGGQTLRGQSPAPGLGGLQRSGAVVMAPALMQGLAGLVGPRATARAGGFMGVRGLPPQFIAWLRERYPQLAAPGAAPPRATPSTAPTSAPAPPAAPSAGGEGREVFGGGAPSVGGPATSAGFTPETYTSLAIGQREEGTEGAEGTAPAATPETFPEDWWSEFSEEFPI